MILRLQGVRDAMEEFWERFSGLGEQKSSFFRHQVPGGWLLEYVYQSGRSEPISHATVFVPDSNWQWLHVPDDLSWEQVHVNSTPNWANRVCRLKLPMGWVVMSARKNKVDTHCTLTYIEDVSHSWLICT
jgi:hypothetical protein